MGRRCVGVGVFNNKTEGYDYSSFATIFKRKRAPAADNNNKNVKVIFVLICNRNRTEEGASGRLVGGRLGWCCLFAFFHVFASSVRRKLLWLFMLKAG